METQKDHSSTRDADQVRRELALEIIAVAREMNDCGLSPGNSGNVSARLPQGFLITPTGMPYSETEVDDLVTLDFNGHHPPTPASKPARRPSSEWHFHAAIYRSRPEVQAIVHAHPRFSTALACTARAIPAFTYMIAMGGGKDIRCAPYAIFGSEDLAGNAVKALESRTACLLEHHGSIALGQSPKKALHLCQEVEGLASQYCEILKIGGEKILSDEQMDAVLEKFKTYGQQEGSGG